MNKMFARMMSSKAVLAGAMALVATGFAVPASAQNRDTPKNWDWEIRDGKKVPKGQVTTNPDGSRREVIRQGSCTTVKEWSASGEYRETRECTPKAD